MKSTGIVRYVDEFGRVGIPIELRKVLNIEEKESMEIYMDNGMIVLTKLAMSCAFCHSKQNLRDYREKHVCENCLRELVRLR